MIEEPRRLLCTAGTKKMTTSILMKGIPVPVDTITVKQQFAVLMTHVDVGTTMEQLVQHVDMITSAMTRAGTHS